MAQVSGWVFDWTPGKQYLLFHLKTADPAMKRVNIQSGVISDCLAKPGVNVYQTKLSPDGEWLTLGGFFAHTGAPNHSRLFIVKATNGSPAPGFDWMLVSYEHGWSDKPRWSPDGHTLYFLSDLDGFLCIRAVRLNPATKRPISAPLPIYHLHNRRHSTMNVGLQLLEIDVAKDKTVMNQGEVSSNIWSLSKE